MKYVYLLIFVPAWLVSANELIDYRLLPAAITTPNCTYFNTYCHSCEKVYYCDPTTKPTLAETCKAGKYCSNGECVANQPLECSSISTLDFPCQTEGILPDPADCQRYHICLKTSEGTESTESNEGTAAIYSDYDDRKCTAGYYYNPRTGYCDLPLVKACTDYVVPECKKGGQTGALTRNPSIYYRCLQYNETLEVLYPFLNICQNGKAFDTKLGCK